MLCICACTHKAVLLTHKKEKNPSICENVHGPVGHWAGTGTKDNIARSRVYVEIKRKKAKLREYQGEWCLPDGGGDTDTDQKVQTLTDKIRPVWRPKGGHLMATPVHKDVLHTCNLLRANSGVLTTHKGDCLRLYFSQAGCDSHVGVCGCENTMPHT